MEDIHNSDQEKYVVDHLTSTANNVLTNSKQKSQGYGIIADIMYLLGAIPNGKHRKKVGLEP